MFTYSLTHKSVLDRGVYLAQLQAANGNISSFSLSDSSLSITSSTEIYGGELSIIDAIVPAQTPVQQLVEQSISAAIAFGNSLVVTFAAENVLLGITQAGKTNAVRKATAEVVNALTTGSLYDAMAECRNILAEDKDLVFVTDARLLTFINKIETYLGLSLSTEL